MMAAQVTTQALLLSELLDGWVAIAAEQDREILGLSLDSRSTCPGDLFFACSGGRSHGAEYISQAIAAGAAAVLCDAAVDEAYQGALEQNVPAIMVEGLAGYLGKIADRFYGQPSASLTVIGVTGTNGKTSCAQFIAQALSADAPCGVIGTLGYGLYGELQSGSHTTPNVIEVHRLMAEMRDAGADSVVMEVSSHGLEQGRVDAVAFDLAVFTNLSRDHLDYHGDMTRYGRAKQRMFEVAGLKHAVINADDAFGRALLHEFVGKLAMTAYSMHLNEGIEGVAMVSGCEVELSHNGMTLHVRDGAEEQVIKTPLLGRFNASNLLAVYALLKQLDMSGEEIAKRLARCTPVDGRMECYGTEETPLVVVDYAHTPDALDQVLQALREHCNGELWCLFGCGGERDQGKRALMGAAAERYADFVVLTDDNPRGENGDAIISDILRGIQQREAVSVVRDRAQAIAQVIQSASADDVVLVAGKGHEDYQLVGEMRIPFSDSEVVKRQLQQWQEASE